MWSPPDFSFKSPMSCTPFNPTLMMFGLSVVSDAHKQQVVGVLCNLGGILPALDLLDGGVNGLGVFKFYDDGRRIDVLARDEHQVGKALARGQLAVDDIVEA